MAERESVGPFGGWFGTLGGFAGMFYGVTLFGGQGILAFFLSLVIGGVVGAWIGLAVEHVVFRLLILASLVVAFLIRSVAFDAIRGVFVG